MDEEHTVVLMAQEACDLRFTEKKIKPKLSNGDDIQETTKTLLNAQPGLRDSILNSFYPLEIVQCKEDKMLYCLNNEHLYILRVMEKQGQKIEIQTKMKGAIEKVEKGVGCHVEIEGGSATKHCNCWTKSCLVL